MVNLTMRLLERSDDRLALVTPTTRATYAELTDRVGRWRGGLAAAGVEPGDRVVLVAGNDELFVCGYLAAVGAGATVVPLNPLSPGPELAAELAAVDAKAALVTGSAAGPDGGWAHLADSDRPPVTLDVAALDAAPAAPIADVAPHATAALLFTSGTAGPSKPAVLTHANLDASLRAIDALELGLADDHQVVLAVIPLFHVFGFNGVINLGLAMGATLVIDDYRGPAPTAALVAAEGVTIMAGPPTLWRALAAADGVEAGSFESVRLALSGAAKLPADVATEARTRLDVPLVEGYGMTETCAVATNAAGTDAPIGSVGRLVPGIEARIVDSDGHDVLIGDPGELWLRGPMVSPGYFQVGADPAIDTTTGRTTATDTGADDGGGPWLRTGDLAVVDEDGYLSIVDRAKDLVIVSGFNVHPAEVEAALVHHPAVAAAGVIGEASDVTGEALVAYVVPTPGMTIVADELAEHCRALLARYKVPVRYEARDELPVGVVGKLRRRQLS